MAQRKTSVNCLFTDLPTGCFIRSDTSYTSTWFWPSLGGACCGHSHFRFGICWVCRSSQGKHLPPQVCKYSYFKCDPEAITYAGQFKIKNIIWHALQCRISTRSELYEVLMKLVPSHENEQILFILSNDALWFFTLLIDLVLQFSGVIGFIFFLELTAVVLAFVFQGQVREWLNDFYLANVKAYRDDIDLQNLIDSLQKLVSLREY